MGIDDIAALVHQMRAPLTAVRWVFETLRKGKLTSEQEDLIKTGVKTSEHLTRIVDDVLNLAKLEVGVFEYNFETMDLASFIKNVIADAQVLAKVYNVELSFNYPEGQQAIIIGDPRRLDIAIFNLIDNGIKYNHPSGKVTVELEKGDKQFMVTVMDTGVGIPEEAQKDLFKKFHRIETPQAPVAKGSGLGLFIVKEIIRGHRGEIRVESEVGKGTTFYLMLPAAK